MGPLVIAPIAPLPALNRLLIVKQNFFHRVLPELNRGTPFKTKRLPISTTTYTILFREVCQELYHRKNKLLCSCLFPILDGAQIGVIN